MSSHAYLTGIVPKNSHDIMANAERSCSITRSEELIDIVDLTLRMALENPSRGYTRLEGALANLGHQLGCGTIANILEEHGIEPPP